MGLRRIAPSEWLLVDDARDVQLATKRASLRDRRADVFAVLPEGEDAWAELDRMLVRHAPYGGHGAPTFAGVQEDLCVLTPGRGGELVLTAACVCFPSHWRLADKMGRPVAAIHGPVPGYERELRAKVDTFLARLSRDTVVARRNWTIHETDELFAPDPPTTADLTIPPEDLWLRSERQTLRRLPATGGIVFTIHTQHARIASVLRRPDVAHRLARRLAVEPPHRAYAPHVPALVRRLTT